VCLSFPSGVAAPLVDLRSDSCSIIHSQLNSIRVGNKPA
jgi:hypothetical protein